MLKRHWLRFCLTGSFHRISIKHIGHNELNVLAYVLGDDVIDRIRIRVLRADESKICSLEIGDRIRASVSSK
jgi:hypothetical protein